jgi:hypothetical protein
MAGKPNSLLEAAQQSMASVRRNMNISAVQARMEVAVTAVIRVMTLFVLETVILPLFFLYLFSQGLKAIWGIDLSRYIRPRQEMLAHS